MVGRLAFFWPTLRNDPAPGFARRDEHKLRSGAGGQPIGQGTVLNAPRGAYFTRATHRRCTLLNAVFYTQAITPAKFPLRRRVRKEVYKVGPNNVAAGSGPFLKFGPAFRIAAPAVAQSRNCNA